MKILSIETSCDETAVSVIDATGSFETGDFSMTVLGNSLLSQMALHAEFGGVFPGLAKREHQKNLVPVLTDALTQASMFGSSDSEVENTDVLSDILAKEGVLMEQTLAFLSKTAKPDIDAIAVTYGPGLEPALWVGIVFAKALALVWGIPIIPVNHMEGHIMVSLMQKTAQARYSIAPVVFPAVSLLVSGGHTEIVVSEVWMRYEVVGQTRDDALGEAFDKVARLMQLPYPGGPEISRLAELARVEELPPAYKQTRPMIHSKDLDFSFSGLKSSIRRLIESQPTWSDTQKQQLAREFEDTVTDTVVAKVREALTTYGAQTLVVGGGVSANKHLRLSLESTAHDMDVAIYLPTAANATDNALMIALAGYFRAQAGLYGQPDTIAAKGTLPLS
jgi:N6-L-threonylcarbamoyladenine synthase